MGRTLTIMLALAGIAGALAGCGDEDPTAVGSELIGPGIATFEVVLEPQEFLLADTTYEVFGAARNLGDRLIAEDFAGELDANTLVHLNRPFTVTYVPEEGGASQTDSLLAIRGGQFTLIVDSAASTPGPVEVEVLPVTERWDPRSVTWTLRVDTADVSEPWATPGGTTGPLAGMGLWHGGDTLVILVDSAAASVWHDTATARTMGALLRTTTTGARLRVRTISFAFDVVPVGRPDTVLTAGSVTRTMHVVNPEEPSPATAEELRVGGMPVWRSLLRFRPLEGLVVDVCAGTIGGEPLDPECDIPLSEASITLAQILLHPREVAGRRIERGLEINPSRVLLAEDIAVLRSPLAPLYPPDNVLDTVPVAFFAPSPPDGVARVRVTEFVKDLVEGVDEEDEDAAPPSDWLALLAGNEGSSFGYMSFSSLESPNPPRLRLLLTLPNRELFE